MTDPVATMPPAPSFRSLRVKIIAPLAAACVVMVALAVAATVRLGEMQARKRLAERAEIAARVVNYAAETVEDPRDLQRLVNSLGSELDVTRIVVVAGSKPRIIASTRNEWVGRLLSDVPGTGIDEDLSDSTASKGTVFHQHQQASEIECIIPLLMTRPDEAFARGAVIVNLDATPVARQARLWALMVGSIFCAALLAAFGGVWLLVSRVVLKPVEAMSRQVAAPGVRIGVPEGTLDELGMLATVLRDGRDQIVASNQELEMRKRILESVIESEITGYWDWDVAAGVEHYSAAWKRMLGFEPHELPDTPETWQRLIEPEDLPVAMAGFRRHVESRGAEPFYAELRYRHKNGSITWVICAGKVIEWSASGEPLRVVGCHVDISRGKAAEASLVHARAQAEDALREIGILRTALDRHSIISTAGRDGRILDANTGFCEVSGYSREELIGQDHRILSSGTHPRSFWRDVWRTLSSGVAWRGEVCNRRKDGSLYWVDSTIVPYVGASGTVDRYISIRFDITRQKLAEARLIAAQTAAEAANAAKSEFLANMSHEIRTPMTAILGFADLLAGELEGDSDPARRTEYLATIRRNGEHLLSIINDILDISKIEAGKLHVESTQVDCAALARDVLTLMDVKARAKGLSLDVRFDSPLPARIATDPVRLRQILVNLVGNAVKFTEVGGITLALSCDREASRLRFDVIDTGIGISAGECERLFGAFEQADASTSRRFGGTGLGLRISRRLAEMLGGRIDVASRPGKGSTFTVTVGTGDLSGVPFVSGELDTPVAEPHPLPPPPASAKPLDGLRILFAEDGPDNQRLIGFQLRKAGATVKIVENGRLAVQELTEGGSLGGPCVEPPPFDLFLSDMQMPEMDGYAAARLLRSMGCRLPIVALTAHAMNGDAERCLEAGCDAYATKPIDRERLVRTILDAMKARIAA
ncbi:MAG: PAS domain-containing protein [Phycisphaerae bacterium]